MAAPEYVPNSLAQQPRKGLPIPPARAWRPDRPGDLAARQPSGATLGNPGPDQGYGLLLAKRFRDRLEVSEHESVADVEAGCLGVGLRRASLFGRAPVIHDFTVAYTIWGFLGGAPGELVDHRRPLFEEAAHHYWDQRHIVDQVPEATLRLLPAQAQQRFPADWRQLLGLA